MDPISITAIAIFGVITLTSLFTLIFNMVNTYQQTQSQKSIAESTKEGLEKILATFHRIYKTINFLQKGCLQIRKSNHKHIKDKLKVFPKVIPLRFFV